VNQILAFQTKVLTSKEMPVGGVGGMWVGGGGSKKIGIIEIDSTFLMEEFLCFQNKQILALLYIFQHLCIYSCVVVTY
jgi:hypothetical protein